MRNNKKYRKNAWMGLVMSAVLLTGSVLTGCSEKKLHIQMETLM